METASFEGEREVDVTWWLHRHGFAEHELSRTIANQTSPLMHAARYGATEMVRELLRRGAPLNARNTDGNNALWFACAAQSLTIIDILCGAGIDLDNQNDDGATCLMYASSAGLANVVQRLLAHGAKVGLRSLENYDALDMASTVECFQLLRSRAAGLHETADRARVSAWSVRG